MTTLVSVPTVPYDVPDHYLEKFNRMYAVGQCTKTCLAELKILPGMTTKAIEEQVKTYAERQNLICAPYGYRGYTGHCCTSVNHSICHEIPSSKVLKDGDIVKVDVTFIKDGWFGDSCWTYHVGEKKNPKAKRVSNATRVALAKGIEQVKPGNKIKDISQAIQDYAEQQDLSVVPDFVGHGISTEFHMPPAIPNYIDPQFKSALERELQVGDTFTIEPMLTMGKGDYKILKDDWTVVTRDRSLSAQWEHTVGVTNTGCFVFTQ